MSYPGYPHEFFLIPRDLDYGPVPRRFSLSVIRLVIGWGLCFCNQDFGNLAESTERVSFNSGEFLAD